jgi:glycosyltransferase involved in cell wall biosynthesis
MDGEPGRLGPPATAPATPATGPALSVIVPMYQAARFIGQALESIRNQTVLATEVIVVDDGSTDAGPAIVAATPGVRLVSKAHTGTGDTVNVGVAIARGDLIAFLDADDRWMADKTALQVAALSRDPTLAMVFGHGRRFVDTGSEERVLDVRPAVSRCSGMFRREALVAAGTFGTGEAHEFMTWMLAAGDAGLRHDILPDVVFERRIHDANHGIASKDHQRRSYFITLKAALDRRRLRSAAPGANGP